MLGGFDDLVADMDMGLLNASTGFGKTIRIIGDTIVKADALILDDEATDRLISSGEKHRGMRVRPGIKIQMRTDDVPEPYQNHLVRLDMGGIDYHIAAIEPVDNNLSVLSLVPYKAKQAGANGWLKDEV